MTNATNPFHANFIHSLFSSPHLHTIVINNT